MTIANVLTDILLALGFFYAVNAIGRGSEGLGYTTFLANLQQSSFGFNAAFRVFAPAVLTGLVSLVLYALGLDQLVIGIWLATVFYWAFRLLYYLFRGWLALIPKGIFFAQAAVSVGLTYYFYVNAYSRGLAAILPQPNDVNFQFWIIVLGFAYLWLNHNAPTASIVDAKRQALRRRHDEMRATYTSLLGTRFQQDVVLRAVFFTFMLAEDFNRGPFWRRIERFLASFGAAKTTGIMQVTSDKVLSDEASVIAAQEIVIELWDDTISEKAAAFGEEYYAYEEGEGGGPEPQLILVSVNPSTYYFSFDAMSSFARAHMSDLYLGYSGNRFEDVDDFFEIVLDAEKANLASEADFTVTVSLPTPSGASVAQQSPAAGRSVQIEGSADASDGNA